MWNNALNRGFKDSGLLNLEDFQKYVPIYNRFANITSENMGTFSPPTTKKLVSVESKYENSFNKFSAKLYDVKSKETTTEDVFFKFSPLMNPIKYSTGKYVDVIDKILVLPGLDNHDSVHENILDMNNSAYVDGYFTYITSGLHDMGFVHGVKFYGTHLAIQNNYKINVSDDFEFMTSSEYFTKNVGKDFDVVNYGNETLSGKSSTSKFKNRLDISDIVDISDNIVVNASEIKTVFLSDAKSGVNGPVHRMTNDLDKMETVDIKVVDLSEPVNIETDMDGSDTDSDCDDSSCSSNTTQSGEESDGSDGSDGSDEEEYSDEEEDSDSIFLHINRFPVMLICMENCDNTYDNYISQTKLSQDEWSSSLMQIIMTMLTYQELYGLTHNDLHTNNIMYVKTEETYLYYVYGGKSYRVPTYGKIFKIIDFGRAIYTRNNMTFCSNSYSKGEDAYSQYNMEPYMNPKKPEVLPNMSFDLARLGCSIFDFLVDDIDSLGELIINDPVVELIADWCNDDSGRNILYKTSGEERYPEFKLYKMIARTVHRHTPLAQLTRPMFSQYLVECEEMDGLGSGCIVMNIDKMNKLVSGDK